MAFVPKNICTFNTEQEITALKTFTEGLRCDKTIVSADFRLSDGRSIVPPAVENMYKNEKGKIVIGHGGKSLSTTNDILLGDDIVEFQKPVHGKEFGGEFFGSGAGLTELNGTAVGEALSVNNSFFEMVDGQLSLMLDESSPLLGTSRGLTIDFNRCTEAHDPGIKDHIIILTSSGLKKVSVSSLLSLVTELNNRVVAMVNNGTNVGTGASLFKGTTAKGRNRNLQFKTIKFDENFDVQETDNEIHVSVKTK